MWHRTAVTHMKVMYKKFRTIMLKMYISRRMRRTLRLCST